MGQFYRRNLVHVHSCVSVCSMCDFHFLYDDALE